MLKLWPVSAENSADTGFFIAVERINGDRNVEKM
jgi:hypothetical protein